MSFLIRIGQVSMNILNIFKLSILYKNTISSGAVLVVFCTAFLLAPQVALSHGGATGVVKHRMDLMDELKKEMKSLSSMYKGDKQYDPHLVRHASDIINSHSGSAITKLFPEGSLSEPSEAKANIWQQWDYFVELAVQQHSISHALFSAADNTPEEPSLKTSNMMGVTTNMMGGNLLKDSIDNKVDLATLPSNQVFKLLIDNCSSCHTRFRVAD